MQRSFSLLRTASGFRSITNRFYSVATSAKAVTNQQTFEASFLQDKYPSRFQSHGPRGSSANIRERADPVVWGNDMPEYFSKEQVDEFKENGFIIVNNLFSSEEVALLRKSCLERKERAERDIASTDQGGKVTHDFPYVTEPKSNDLRSEFAVHKQCPTARRVCEDERVAGRAMQLLNDNVYIHQSRVNFQPPIVGTGFYWHSDFETWHSEDGMPVPRAVSAVVLLSDNRPYNGSLMVMPGSHKFFASCLGETPDANWESSLKEQQKAGTPSRDQLRMMARQDDEPIKYCAGNAGSVVFFDSNLMHGSHNNISPYDRVNLFYVYNAVSNRLVEPYHAKTHRPEHIATRDERWQQPIKPISGLIGQ